MNQFLSLPDWAPGWLGPVLVILGALFALAFLLMPFTVFSLKSRLEQIEGKLDELRADLALVETGAPAAARSHYAWPEPPVAAPPVAAPPVAAPPAAPPPVADRYPVRPPISPVRAAPARAPDPLPPEPARRDPYRDEPRAGRAEPKLNWPR